MEGPKMRLTFTNKVRNETSFFTIRLFFAVNEILITHYFADMASSMKAG